MSGSLSRKLKDSRTVVAAGSMTSIGVLIVTNPIPPEAEFYLDEFDAERFWAHVEFHGGRHYADDPLATAKGECWLWNGAVQDHHYGRFKVFGEWRQAHRIAYKDFGKSLPDELEIDHLCRIHSCVNPSHLEPVTRIENARRGITANKTHCPNGHEYTEQNTHLRNGYRYCLICLRESRHKTYIRRKQAA